MKKKILSVLLSASMLMTMSGMTALASSVEAVPAETEARAAQESLLRLWYDKPVSGGATILSAGDFGTTAEDNRWQQLSIPIGNSYMGANVYGEITDERLTFNQKTLWNGGPSESRPNYNGGNKTTAPNGKLMTEAYKDVVDAFLNGASNASNLCEQLVGESNDAGGYGSYQSWGDIYLTFQGLGSIGDVSGYSRDLDLEQSIANVDFTKDGTSYHREYFISHPDNVLAMKLTAEGGNGLSLNVKFPVDNAENVANKKLGKDAAYTADADAKRLVMAGKMQDNQMKMNSVLQVVTEGTVTAGANGESLDIKDADEVIIFVAADTDYKNDYPTYRTGETDEELAASVAKVIDDAMEKGYDAVKEDHIADYQSLFNRLHLDLGQEMSDKTTDALLAAYKAQSASESERRLLEVLLYQYGRYLTIASSREGDLPSNLQGVWQNRVGTEKRVPWGCDYHMNVNLQMNYWPTYSGNLTECAIPLIDYVDSLREPGRVTAAAYFGIESGEGEENGFTAHTQNTPFGWTCPGWAFSWGWSPAAVPWILQNCWEYYEYTGDVEFMRERLYPMLREEAVLYDQILVDSGTPITKEDGTTSTRLVSAPTFSPEHGPRTLGNAYEQELIWQLYEDVITAAEILQVDADKVEEWKETQSRLAPIEVGESGQIKEWYHETTLGSEGQRGHRHMSHLLGLYPGDLISVDNDEYMDAAIVSLADRGMKSTGWGMGQRINAWARTGQGNQAYQLIKTLFNDGIYPNMWDTHAPFQIDGNFGYTSGVNEMLMQSNMGYINLLAAIPDDWSEGHVDGLLARGNFELTMNWSAGQIDDATILSGNGGEAVVQNTNIFLASVTDENGKEVETRKISDNRIAFDTEKGKSYTISQIPKKAGVPTGLQAARSNDDSVALSWNAVAGENTYNVYRQIGEGEMVKLASGVKGVSYTDEKAYSVLGDLTYQITAGVGGAESEPSVTVSVLNAEMVDDQDSRVQYVGEWGNWNSDSDNYNGTIKYLEKLTGSDTASLRFNGTGIGVITCTNNDRGKLEITIDGVSYGEVDTYSASTVRQKEIFTKTDLAPGEHTLVVRATNTKNNSSSRAKVELDAFRIISSAAAPTLPSGEKSQVLAAEPERVMIQWAETENADSYKVYVDGKEVASATDSYAWVEGLEAGKEYTFVVKAVVGGTEVQTSVEVKAKTAEKATLGEVAGEEPDAVSEVKVTKGKDATQAKLSWQASKGAAKYVVYVNGQYAGETAEPNYELSGLTDGKQYQVKIVAVGAGGKNSAVTKITFQAGEFTEDEKVLSEVAALQAFTVKYGTAFAQLALPKTVKVVVQPTAETFDAEIQWQQGAYNGNAAGTYTLYGELILPEGVKNPEKKQAAITVTVQKKADDTVISLPIGTTEDAGNFKYKVTSADKLTVEVVKLNKPTLAAVKVFNTVKLSDGKTYKVTSVAASVFKKNKKMKSLTIGKNVEAIRNGAFTGCTALKKVTISSTKLKQIGSKAFNGCKKLTSIKIKSKVLKKVGKNAFKGIHKKAVIKVPKAKLKAYRKLLAKKGQSKTVVIKK